MKEFDVNKEYKIGDKLVFNGAELTIEHRINCKECFFIGQCIEQQDFLPICCGYERDDRNDIIFVESKE